jgi:hypothetical protein
MANYLILRLKLSPLSVLKRSMIKMRIFGFPIKYLDLEDSLNQCVAERCDLKWHQTDYWNFLMLETDARALPTALVIASVTKTDFRECSRLWKLLHCLIGKGWLERTRYAALHEFGAWNRISITLSQFTTISST